MAGGVVSIDEANGFPMAPEGGSERFGAFIRPLGDRLGLKKLGCMAVTVEPGMRAFPFHNHHGNDGLDCREGEET